MTNSEKDLLKLRFGLALLRIIQVNKEKSEENKRKGSKDIHLIDSLRKLEAASGIPYASIHRIATGTKNAGFTTIAAIIEGLSITFTDFFSKYYYSITDSDIETYIKEKEKKRKSAIKKNTSKKTSVKTIKSKR